MDHAECLPANDARLVVIHDKDRPAGFDPSGLDRPGWEKRAAFLRDQALVAQGLWPPPVKTPIEPVIHGRIERDAYTVEKVFFASLPGHYVSGNLYRPKGRSGKLPAVLAPYGHWPDGRFIWKSDEDARKGMAGGAERDLVAARSPLQANCAMLARMGCVVFHYDMVGYCDNQAIPHREGFLDVEAVLRLQSYMGLQTWNSIRSLDFVLSLPDVDPTRIAVSGSSSGGTQTIALSATDPRPSVAFPIVMVSMNMQGGCVCENAPLYRVGTNNVELASLFAPRPQGVAAANDWTHDFETRGLPEMKTVWRLLGAESMIEGKHFDYGHNHNLHSREMQYSFLNRHLKLGWAEPVREAAFEPVHPSQLSVYDAAHPVPADAVGAEGVRAWMTRTTAEQIARMTPVEHAGVVRTALRAMVVDEMPAADAVEVNDGCLSRRGAGEHVPFEVVRPGRPSGDAVVWAHPAGRAGARADQATLRRLTDAGWTVVVIDPFGAGALQPAKAPPAPARSNVNPPYHGGYVLGYQRSILANRVHDLLSAIAMARGMEGVRRVHLLASGEQGPAGLLARALAGDAVARAAIDLDQFDFDRVKDDTDPMLLPGALKYGGIHAFVPLFENGSSLISGARETGEIERARQVDGVSIDANTRPAGDLAAWLTRP